MTKATPPAPWSVPEPFSLTRRPNSVNTKSHDFFAGVVFGQVVVEIADGIGHIAPQSGHGSVLVGMGVECAGVQAGVEDAGPETGEVYLGHVLQPLSEGQSRRTRCWRNRSGARC